MAEDKCFCHLGGFAVKDAYARKKIEEMEENAQELLEYATDEDIDAMFEGYEGGAAAATVYDGSVTKGAL